MGVRLRYTLLYGGLSLLSGAVLLTIVALVSVRSVTQVAPGAGSAPLPAAEQIARLREQLADADQAHTRGLLYGAAVALAVLVLLSLVLGRAAAGRVLRPLRTITAATRRISADNLHERLAVSGPADEVKDLADTVDDLLGRLEDAFAAQRRFVADASHELRTPLATMRASIDVAMAKPSPPPAETVRLADRLRASLDEVDALLDGFLVLARAQHGALDDRTVVPLGALVARFGDRVRADVPPGVATRGNAVLLARMVDNVLDNAVRHGSSARVVARPDAAAGVVRLEVTSDGPPLDPAQVDRLGRPFQRLGADRTGGGTGLGLAIVAAIAAAHGGSAVLAARPAGGLLVTITLPRA
jgi:signal transduction histidine kinase